MNQVCQIRFGLMSDTSSRRDLLGQIVVGSVVASLVPGDTIPPAEAVGMADNVAVIRLFTAASGVRLSPGCELVWTSGFSQVGNGAACYLRDATIDAAYVRAHPRTAFLDADRRAFRLIEQAIDVRQVGAIGDGSADDTVSIQMALDLVEAGGGGTVSLSAGNYRTTAPLKLPPRTGLRGAGPSAILRVQGCDGILVGASDEASPRTLSDFTIHGRGCERFRAIVADVADDRRNQGMVFERLYLAFFGTGVSSRGLWHATFRTIAMNQIWKGFLFTGRNVKITIDDCRLIHGGLLQGAGDPIGIQVGDETPIARPEDVQIARSIIYGFAKGIVWRTALFGGVTHCDLDACTRTGLELVTADGGFTFANNWVHVDGPSARGIDCTPLGYIPQMTNILIANNSINAREMSRGSCGIAVGNQQADLVIDGNSISEHWETGISANGVRRLSMLHNKVARGIVAEHCKDVTVSKNFAGGGLRLNDNTGLNTGAGSGSQSGQISGTLTIPAGQSGHTTTFAALELPDLPEGSYRTALRVEPLSSGAEVMFYARITQTGITVETARALLQETSVAFRVNAC